MTYSLKCLITEINDLAEITDPAGSPITNRELTDIGYTVLQHCTPFNTTLLE